MSADFPTQHESSATHWPSLECWRAFVIYGTLLSALWIVVYGGASVITSWHSLRVELFTQADLQMPFVAAASVVYLSLMPMLWVAPFALRSREELREFALRLAILFVLSGVGYLILPSDEVRPRPSPTGVLGQLFDFADWMNLSYNNLPCLHASMAIVCAAAYSRASGWQLALVYWTWAVAISLSTLFTHQHYIVDVLAGAALAVAVSRMPLKDLSGRVSLKDHSGRVSLNGDGQVRSSS